MKIKYIKFPKWLDFTAINLFNCLLINNKYKEALERFPALFQKLINHEHIHTAQARELLWVFFYVFYFLEWLVRLVQYRKAKLKNGKKDWNAAYRNISFEREAYANEGNFSYLAKRKRFASFVLKK